MPYMVIKNYEMHIFTSHIYPCEVVGHTERIFCVYIHREKFRNIKDTFKRVNGILVYLYILAGISMRIARDVLVKISAEMLCITRIATLRCNVSWCRTVLSVTRYVPNYAAHYRGGIFFWILSNLIEYDRRLTVFLLNMNPVEVRLVYNQKENGHYMIVFL